MKKPITRLLDLPGIQNLENHLLMEIKVGDRSLTAFRQLLDQVTIDLFGISTHGTHFKAPEGYKPASATDEERRLILRRLREHEKKFHCHKLNGPEKQVAYLRRHGWDLTNDRGQSLLITEHISRVIEAVAKGIAGTAPSREKIGLEAWSQKMEFEAAKFNQSRRRHGS